MTADGKNHIFVGMGSPGNTVAEYDATTGAIINAAFITQGLNNPTGLAVDGNNHLFVANGSNGNGTTVGEYDATTGATINAAFINGQGLNGATKSRRTAITTCSSQASTRIRWAVSCDDGRDHQR